MKRGRKQTRVCVFPKLRDIITRNGFSLLYLSDASGIEYTNLRQKLYGDYPLRLSEAIAIKEAVMSDLPLEELFQTA